MREQRIGLKHHRRAAPGRRKIGDDDIAEAQVSRRDVLMAGDHAQRRGLAAAGRTEEAAIASGGDFQADGVYGGGGAVHLGNGYDIDLCGFRHERSPCTREEASIVPISFAEPKAMFSRDNGRFGCRLQSLSV
ncbi:hypothetical protein D9M72_591670 [compost metagenome]